MAPTYLHGYAALISARRQTVMDLQDIVSLRGLYLEILINGNAERGIVQGMG